jgi:uncharacterized repeat protein (TIGR01451 family)
MRILETRAFPTVLLVCLILLLMTQGSDSLLLRAGEPIRVGSPTFGTDAGLFVFTTLPISYTTDGGNLGSPAKVPTPVPTMVDSMFALWQAVPTSNIAFTNAGSITAVTSAGCVTDGDVDTLVEYNCLSTNGFPGNPIIFDVDGSLIDAVLGAGSSNGVLGFAGPLFSTASGGIITGGRAVLNGKFVDNISTPPTNPETTVANMQATALHEFGHFFGLGHSQVNDNCLSNPGTGTCAGTGSEDSFGLPTMYPISFGLQESSGVPAELTLATDDIAWVSLLYPDPNATTGFAATHGTISGTLFASDGQSAIQGGNMIARQVDNAGTPGIREDRRFAVSTVSGYLFTGNRGQSITGDNPGSNQGSRNVALYGTYSIPVPAGDYTLEVESINSQFTGGSSVGPHGRAVGEVFPIPGPAEFFSSPESNSDTTPGTPATVNVTANNTTSSIDIILNGTANSKDAFDTVASNDTVGTATPLGNGTTSASISPLTGAGPDMDVYAFTALANTTVTFNINARGAPYNDFLDSVLEVVNSSGTRQNLCDTVTGGVFTDACLNDDENPGVVRDSLLRFQSSTAGTFYLRVFDWRGDARADFQYDLVVTGAGQAPPPAGCDSDFDGGPAGTGTDWNTAANWNPDGLPTGKVCIGATFSVTHASGTNTITDLQNIAGNLTVSGGTLTVTASSGVGGTLTASGTGTVNLGASNITNLTMNGGTLNFAGPTAFILGLTFNNGTMSAVSGTVNLPAAGYTHAGGTMQLTGGSVVTAGTITQTGGTIQGNGSLTANIVQNGGTLGLGLSPGILNLIGNFTQNAGTVVFEIGGTTVGTQYDRFNISGNAVQNGNIDINLISAFVPNIGDTFTLATFASGTGTGTTNFPAAPPGGVWVDVSTATEFIVQVQAVSGCPVGAIQYDGGPSGTGTAFDLAANWAGDAFPANLDACIDVAIATTYAGTNIGSATLNSLTVTNNAQVFTQSGGTLTLNNASAIGTGGFTLSGGALQGAGSLDIAGLFTWTAGSQQDAGVTNANGGSDLSGPSGTNRVLGNRTLNLNGTTTWGTATTSGAVGIIMSGIAVVNNNGTLLFQNDQNTAANQGFGGAGTFNNNVGGIVRKTTVGVNTGQTVIGNVTFNNFGTVEVQSGTLFPQSGGSCGGTCAGSWDVSAGATLRFGGGTFSLSGPIAGAGNVTFSSGTTEINNTYDITGGTTFSGGTVNFNAASTISNLGALLLSSGTANFSSTNTTTITQGTFTQSGGTLTGTATFNVTGLLTWTGGTQSGTGVTNANGGSDFSGPSGTGKTLTDRMLNLSGTTTWGSAATSGRTFIQMSGAAVVNNNGTILFQNETSTGFQGFFGTGSSAFNNNGIVRRTDVPAGSNTGETVFSGTVLNNFGTVEVQAGTLNPSSGGSCGGTCAGSWDVSAGATLRFGGGTFEVSGPVSGAGTVQFSSGTVNYTGTYNITGTTIANGGTANFNPASTIAGIGTINMGNGTLNLSSGDVITQPTFTQNSGTLTGSDTFNITGLFTWTGGTQSGTGITNANGGVDFSGVTGSSRTLNNRTLNLFGTSTWGTATTSGRVFLNMSAGVINNNGTLLFQNDENSTGFQGFFGSGTVNNLGTLRKAAVGTNTGETVISISFNNSGTVEVLIGTLVASTYAQSAGVTRMNGGALRFSTPMSLAGGLLEGASGSTITGSVNNTGGILGPGLTPGILNLTGTYTQSGTGSFGVEVSGLTPGTQHDQLAVTGSITLGGPVNVTFPAFSPSAGQNFTILTFSGTRTGLFSGVNCPALPGGLVCGLQYNPNSVVLQVNAEADLAVTKTDVPDPASVGQNVSYTVTVTNNGPSDATGVVLTDVLPATIGFVSATPSQGSCPTTPAVGASGTVTCNLGTIANAANANVVIVVTPLAAGSITNTASATANEVDPNNANNTGITAGTTVNQGATTTAVVSSQNPSFTGQSVTFTATVTVTPPAAGTPTGTVNFFDGVTNIGAGTLAAGVATLATSSLGIGSHNITAVYAGDANFTTSTSPVLVQVVNQGTTSTAVTSSVNPTVFGESTTFTATVTVLTGVATPTGTVNFFDGATNIGSGTLNASLQATLNIASLSVGAHSITAVYVGDANFTGSTSPAITQTVNQAATSTAVVSSANPSVFGQSVTITATVSATAPGAGTPTGTVNFFDGATNIGTGTLAAGVATLSTSSLSVGAHSITAVYAGDTNFTGSTSPILTQTVNQAATSTAVVSSANPSVFGQPVTFTATVAVTAPGAGTPTGTVDFFDGATNIGSGTLNASLQATLSTSSLSVAAHSITAVYSGDANFTTSTSPVLTQTVNRAPTTTSVVTSQTPVNFGTAVTFTATVAVAAPGAGTSTGTVNFFDGAANIGTGTLNASLQATLTTSTLPTGNRSITAVYAGDTNFDTSTSPAITQVVNPVADMSITASDAPDPVNVGSNIVYTVVVTNNGPNPATGVTATTVVPAGLTLITATATQGTCTLAAGTITCTIGNMANAATVTATITVQTGAAAAPSVSLTGTVTATEFDPNNANNSATVTTTVNPAADLAVTKSDSPDPVIVGNNVTYTVTVVNNGPSNATGVTVTDTLPTNGTFVSSTPAGPTCTVAAGVLTCNLGTINAGANSTVTIVVTAPATPGSMSNSVTVASGIAELNNANNSATATTTVNSASVADFSVSATPSLQSVFPGNSTGFTVTASSLAGFSGNVNFTCSTTAPLATCTVTPAQVAVSASTPGTALVSVSTTANTSAPGWRGARNFPPPSPLILRWLPLFFSAMLAMMLWASRRKHSRQHVWGGRFASIALIVMLSVFAAGCLSTGGAFGTPTGTYNVTITGTSGSLAHSTTTTLVVR